MIIVLATLKVMAESIKDSGTAANLLANFKGSGRTTPSLQHRDKIRRDSKKYHP